MEFYFKQKINEFNLSTKKEDKLRIAKEIFDVLEEKRQKKYEEDEFTIGDVDEDRFEFF